MLTRSSVCLAASKNLLLTLINHGSNGLTIPPLNIASKTSEGRSATLRVQVVFCSFLICFICCCVFFDFLMFFFCFSFFPGFAFFLRFFSFFLFFLFSLFSAVRVYTGLQLCSVDSTRSLQQLAFHSRPQSSLSQHTPGHGSIGVCHFSGDPGQSLTVTRRWLQWVVFPLLGQAWLRRLWCGLALLSNVRFAPASILAWLDGDWPDVATMLRWTNSPAQRRCVFVCVLHQSSRQPHSLCLSCCSVFADLRLQWCAAPYVAPAEASHGRGTLGFSIQRTWPTPFALCAFVGQVCARVDSSDDDVLLNGLSTCMRSSEMLFSSLNAPSSFSLCLLFCAVIRIRSRQGHHLSAVSFSVGTNFCINVSLD